METVAQKTMFTRLGKPKRAWELDFLRGLAVLLMCFDHLMYDFSHLNVFFSNANSVDNGFINGFAQFAKWYWNTGDTRTPGLRFWGHYIFVFVFLFLVGVSCAFSRDNVRRGSKLAVLALAFTGVTMVLKAVGIMTYGIVFGILDCIALSILICAALDIATEKTPAFNVFLPLVIGAGIMAAGVALKFWDMSQHPFDRAFNAENLIGYIMGTNSYGDDWFGLFPYIGAVLVGMYFGKTAYAARQSLLPWADGKWNKPVGFVGRHALIFYLAHQVVIAGLVICICLCIGFRF